jgi:hypothetical protein
MTEIPETLPEVLPEAPVEAPVEAASKRSRAPRAPRAPRKFDLKLDDLIPHEGQLTRLVRIAAKRNELTGAERHEWVAREFVIYLDNVFEFKAAGEAVSDLIIRLFVPMLVRRAYRELKQRGILQ